MEKKRRWLEFMVYTKENPQDYEAVITEVEGMGVSWVTHILFHDKFSLKEVSIS